MSLLETFSLLTSSVERHLDRHRHLVLTALSVGWFLLLVLIARDRPLWHDEIYTALVSRLPFPTMWRAYLDAIDLSPPLNTMVTRVVHLLVGEGPVATRFPAMLGFIITCLVLFTFVRRRTNVLMALAASLLPFSSVAWKYAAEARGYGLTMACFACALFGWSEAAAGRHPRANLALMSVAMAAGMWTHYYFVLAVIPIALGEVARQASLRRLDWRPWMAMGAASLASLPLLPLTSVALAQRETFWARPSTLEFATTYAYLLGPLAASKIRLLAFGALGVTALAATASHLVRRSSPRRLATHDLVACLLCLLLPAIGVLLGFWVDAFHQRYVTFAIFGILAAAPLLLWSISPSNRMVESAALAAALAFAIAIAPEWVNDRARAQALSGFDGAVSQDSFAAHRPLLAGWVEGGQHVFVTGEIHYLPLWYYSPPEAQPHVMYLADPEGQLSILGSDTIDRGYLALSRWLPLPVVPVDDFRRTHRHFYLYAPNGDATWRRGRIRTWSPNITRLGRDQGGELYEIELRR